MNSPQSPNQPLSKLGTGQQSKAKQSKAKQSKAKEMLGGVRLGSLLRRSCCANGVSRRLLSTARPQMQTRLSVGAARRFCGEQPVHNQQRFLGLLNLSRARTGAPRTPSWAGSPLLSQAHHVSTFQLFKQKARPILFVTAGLFLSRIPLLACLPCVCVCFCLFVCFVSLCVSAQDCRIV